MLRFLVSARALALLAALIVLAAAFSALAVWQWDRAHSRIVDPLTRAAVPLDDLSGAGTAAVPSGAVGREVSVRGSYEGQRTFVVPVDGASGRLFWAMTPLRLSDGSVVPVVHGQVKSSTGSSSAAGVVVPKGTVEVTGRLQPSQASTAETGGALSAIATSEIVGLVDAPIRPGFVLAESQTPQVRGVTSLPSGVLIVPPKGVRIQNVLYTLQWSLFSAFVFYVYWRLMRDAWRDYQAEHAMADDADGPDGSADERNHVKETTA